MNKYKTLRLGNHRIAHIFNPETKKILCNSNWIINIFKRGNYDCTISGKNSNFSEGYTLGKFNKTILSAEEIIERHKKNKKKWICQGCIKLLERRI